MDKKKILIADDEPSIRLTVTKKLELLVNGSGWCPFWSEFSFA